MTTMAKPPTYKQACRELVLVGSERRAEVLVDLLQRIESKTVKRRLIRDWFNNCEALRDHVYDLRMEWDDLGYITDAPKVKHEFPLTVYRAAWEDDDLYSALSWTTNLETAKFFARYHTSLRARIVLGTYRDDVDMIVWQGTALSVLGYFEDRGEYELVPGEVTDVRGIMVLQDAPEAGA